MICARLDSMLCLWSVVIYVSKLHRLVAYWVKLFFFFSSAFGFQPLCHTCAIKGVYNFTFSLLFFFFPWPCSDHFFFSLKARDYSHLNLSGNSFQTRFYGVFQLWCVLSFFCVVGFLVRFFFFPFPFWESDCKARSAEALKFLTLVV